MSRPEKYNSALEYYTEEETQKYSKNSHIWKVQTQMTLRCAELINIQDGKILDIGCGSGHSISALLDYSSENNYKNDIVGLDINENMLKLCRQSEEFKDITLVCDDIGQGLPFYPGSFDYIISVSCIQWLFYPLNKERVEDRIKRFFASLFSVMRRDCSACFQMYFEARWQIELILKITKRIGFNSNIVRDGEGKKQKFYLLLDLYNKRRKLKYCTEELVQKQKKQKSKTVELNSDSSDALDFPKENNTGKRKKKRSKKSNKKRR